MQTFYIQSRYVDNNSQIGVGAPAYTNLGDACRASSYNEDSVYLVEIEIDDNDWVQRTENLVTITGKIDLERTPFVLHYAKYGFKEQYVWFIVERNAQHIPAGSTGYMRRDFAIAAAQRSGGGVLIGVHTNNLSRMRDVNAFVKVNLSEIDISNLDTTGEDRYSD